MDSDILKVLEIVKSKLIADEIRVRKGRIKYDINYQIEDGNYISIRIIGKVRNKKFHRGYKINCNYYGESGYKYNSCDINITFRDGIKHGLYRKTKGSTIINYIYENDILQGEYSKEHENGNSSGFYVNGRKHGPYNSTYRNTTKTCNYENGLLHGVYLRTEDDKILVRCNYVNGKKYGVYEENYESGSPYIRAEYYNNLLQGEYMKYHKNGKLEIYCSRYIDGKKCGIYAIFNQDGDLEIESEYRDDIKNGICKTYYRMYNIVLEEIYDNGVVTSTNKYPITQNEFGRLLELIVLV